MPSVTDLPSRRFGEERWFTPRQIASRLGYRDDSAIWKAIRAGALTASRPSRRRVVVSESAVEAWLESLQIKALPAPERSTNPAKRARRPAGERRTMPVIGRTVTS